MRGATEGRVVAYVGPGEADRYLGGAASPIILQNASAPGPAGWLRITEAEDAGDLVGNHDIHIGRLGQPEGIDEWHAMYRRVIRAAGASGRRHTLPATADGSTRVLVDMNAETADTLSLPKAWTAILRTEGADRRPAARTLTREQTRARKREAKKARR